MAEQLKLFAVDRPPYPFSPGFKRRGTSEEAARRVEASSKTLKVRCLRELQEGPKTADEIAMALSETVLAVRPRIAELHKQGRVVDTLRRRLNESGHRAIVWEAT